MTNVYTIISLISFLTSIVLFLIVILEELHSIHLAKRFDAFSLKSSKEEETSFFDFFSSHMDYLIKKISKVLKKSAVCLTYAKHYEKYITFEEKESKESMDFITLKLLNSCLFVFLTLFFLALKNNKINPLSFLISFIFGFFILDIMLNIEFKKKRKEIEDDLLKAIIIMNNSFKSGKNIMQAIGNVKNELSGPIADEFKKIYLDITYGLSLEVVFDRFYERVKLEDAKYIASSLTLLNKTGGNITKVFASIEESFFNKKKMQDELQSMTSSSKFVFKTLTILPIVFSLIIFLLNKDYFTPLFKTSLGIFIFIIIVSLYVCYILTVKKVLKVNM